MLSYEISGTHPQTAQRLILGATDAQDRWISTGPVPVNLSTAGELGPGLLLPDGRVFWVGDASNTALYTPPPTLTGTGTWLPGPTIPRGLGGFDAPGAVMPNGKVLFAASSGYAGPTSIFEFDPNTNLLTDVTPTGPNTPDLGNSAGAFIKRMLVLPSGEVLFGDQSTQLWVYRPDGSPNASWKPTITGITNNGASFTLTGTQLNGLSEGAAYGDDAQMASNFPIVKLTSASGTVYFARTFNWSSTGVATGSTPESTQFTLPAAVTPGVYQLSVIANGIASNSVLFVQMGAGANILSVRVKPGDSSRLQVLQAGTLLAEYPFNSFYGIMVAGAPGLGALTLDLSNGNPIPADGFSYDGAGTDNEILVSGSNALKAVLGDTSLTVTSAGTFFGKVSLRGGGPSRAHRRSLRQ
jgi:hypothetical protein